MKEDFIQNIQFDLFSVELVIGETATLLLAENYVTIREVFVDGAKVEPNENKQIFLQRGGDDLWELNDDGILQPKENKTFTIKKAYEVNTETGSTDKYLNEQGDFTKPINTHSDLTDKNTETDYQHVDTTENTETFDKVVVVDGEGNVVVTDKTNVGGSGVEIDDTTTSTTKVWSSNKTSSEVGTKQNTLVSGTNIKTINGVSILGNGNITTRALTLVTTNNNNFQVDFSGDLHYNTVPAGQTNNLGFTCVNCPTTNKEFVYIVANNRTTLLQTALPASPIVQGGITYTFKRTTATTTVGISAGASCEFNFLFIKIDDTNFEVRIAVQKSVV